MTFEPYVFIYLAFILHFFDQLYNIASLFFIVSKGEILEKIRFVDYIWCQRKLHKHFASLSLFPKFHLLVIRAWFLALSDVR